MKAIRAILMVAMVAGLEFAAAKCEAKRLTLTMPKSSSSAAAHTDRGLKMPGVIASSSNRSSAEASAPGYAVGSAAATTMTEADKGQLDMEKAAAAEQKRQEKLTDFQRAAELEEAARKAKQVAQAAEMRRKADLAAREVEESRRKEAVEAKRRAAEERQAELKRQAVERENSCIIKPAMTDAEIDHCKWAWSFPPPG